MQGKVKPMELRVGVQIIENASKKKSHGRGQKHLSDVKLQLNFFPLLPSLAVH